GDSIAASLTLIGNTVAHIRDPWSKAKTVDKHNNDLQRIVSVVLAGLVAVLKLVGENLADHKFLFLRAGE
ncbi:hypothetical protein S83_019698, partial [Arachis hypogaea]